MKNSDYLNDLHRALVVKNPKDNLKDMGFNQLSDHDVLRISEAVHFIGSINFEKIKNIADIGSGPGHHSYIFSQMGLQVSCIDFVRNNYGYEHIDPTKIAGRSFDAIWSHHSLEHIPNPLSALCNWNKLLKKGGEIFITVPEFDCVMSSGHINSYSCPLLIYHLAIAGFSTVDKRFIRDRSHIKVAAIKALSVDGNNFCTSLTELANQNLFPPSVANQIFTTGRFDTSSLHPNWFGQKFTPRRKFNESLEFIKNSCFERKC